MFGNTISGLEKKATKNLGKITDFIEELRTTKENAVALKQETKDEISKLNTVVKQCDEASKFVDKIFK